jgi:hypothetical protein
VVNGALEFGDAPKGSSANHALRDQCEPTLDLIEPGAAGRDEMQVESATLLGVEPALNSRTFVGCVSSKTRRAENRLYFTNASRLAVDDGCLSFEEDFIAIAGVLTS